MLLIKKRLDEYTSKENNLDSNLANIIAILMENVNDLNWVGLYMCNDELQEMHVSHFQGKPAVNKISYNNGVCGQCARERKTIIVRDVHECPDHIVCDVESRSELVVPIFNPDGSLFAVLDVDSPIKNRYSEIDIKIFEYIALYIQELIA